MNNGYIFRYAAILVIIVAALLSLAAVVLAPYQQRNKDNEKRKNILRAAGIADLSDSNVQQLFTKHCTACCSSMHKATPLTKQDWHLPPT